jgi:hypothetical protein
MGLQQFFCTNCQLGHNLVYSCIQFQIELEHVSLICENIFLAWHFEISLYDPTFWVCGRREGAQILQVIEVFL